MKTFFTIILSLTLSLAQAQWDPEEHPVSVLEAQWDPEDHPISELHMEWNENSCLHADKCLAVHFASGPDLALLNQKYEEHDCIYEGHFENRPSTRVFVSKAGCQNEQEFHVSFVDDRAQGKHLFTLSKVKFKFLQTFGQFFNTSFFLEKGYSA